MNGYIKVIIAVLLFSLGPLLVKLIDLDGVSILWCVSITAVVFLTLRAVFEGGGQALLRFNKGIGLLLSLGIFTTINNSLFNTAIKTTTISNAVLTHHLAPVFLLIFAAIFIKERITKVSVMAIILSFVGLAIMLSPNELALSNEHLVGLLLGTASAVFFALESLLKKMLTEYYKADIIVIWYLFISLIILIPFVSYGDIITLDMFGVIALLAQGIIIVGGGSTLLTSGLKTVKAQHFGVISYLEPLGAIIWGVLIILEIPAIESLIGGGLILVATYMIMKTRKKI